MNDPPASTAPFLSIIVPCHNSSAKLAPLLRTLARLGPDDAVELIFVDDGSADDTRDRLQAFAKASTAPVQVIAREHAGPGAARNAGLDAATGEFVWFVDSDDDIDLQALNLVRGSSDSAVDMITWDVRCSGEVEKVFDAGLHVVDSPPGPEFTMGPIWLSRAFLARTGLRFPEYCFFEDHLFTVFLLPLLVRSYLHVGFPAYEIHLTVSSVTRANPRARLVAADQLANAALGMEFANQIGVSGGGRRRMEQTFIRLFLWYSIHLSKLPGVPWLDGMRVMRQFRSEAARLNVRTDPFSVYPGRSGSRRVARALLWLSRLLPSQNRHFAHLRQQLWGREIVWERPFTSARIA